MDLAHLVCRCPATAMDTTNRMLDWCNNGTTLLFVNGGNLIASAIDAAKGDHQRQRVTARMASDL